MASVYSPNPNRYEAPVDLAKCAASISRGSWSHGQCDRKGTLEHEGRLWCKQHHPPAVDAKRKAEHAKSEAKYEARNRELEQKNRDAADIPKFRALAKRAAALVPSLDADKLHVFGVLRDLASMHKEE